MVWLAPVAGLAALGYGAVHYLDEAMHAAEIHARQIEGVVARQREWNETMQRALDQNQQALADVEARIQKLREPSRIAAAEIADPQPPAAQARGHRRPHHVHRGHKVRHKSRRSP
jgi:hypothetical protein